MFFIYCNSSFFCCYKSFRMEKEERSRDLKTIELYRQQTKREGIQAMLNQSISTEHTIHPCMGNTEFFEFVLKNPYNNEFTIIVESDDPDLMYVLNLLAWSIMDFVNFLVFIQSYFVSSGLLLYINYIASYFLIPFSVV